MGSPGRPPVVRPHHTVYRVVLFVVVAFLVIDGAAILNRHRSATSPIPKAPSGWWSPSHVSAGGGRLLIKAYLAETPDGERWVTGGIGQRPGLAQTYGRYLVRMRSSGGKGISVIALLFPTKGWPPEIDFYEDAPTNNQRVGMTATLHFNRDNAQIQHHLAGVDFTQWQTIGVDWEPGRLTYTINGKVWATIVGSHVPSVPMTLDIQSQALTCSAHYTACPGSTTPALVTTEVAWVAVYQRNHT
jgi:hypothetical protein